MTAPHQTWCAASVNLATADSLFHREKFTQEWPKISGEATLGQNFVLGNLISSVTRGLKGEEDRKMLQEWLRVNPIPGAKRILDKVGSAGNP